MGMTIATILIHCYDDRSQPTWAEEISASDVNGTTASSIQLNSPKP